VLNFTTDEQGDDNLHNSKGVNSYTYTTPSRANKTLFSVHNCTAPRRTAGNIAAPAKAVQAARAGGRTVAYQTSVEDKCGIECYSLFFAPSPDMRTASPYLKDLWDMGPTAVQYDTMHLGLLNFVPHLCKHFSGLKLVNKDKDLAYTFPKSTVALAGRELRNARRNVPRAHAVSLRNIDVHHKSFKAVDWMHIVLYTEEGLLSGRIPGKYYNIFMELCRACRLLVRPRGESEAELKTIDVDIKYVVANYCAKIFRGSVERLPLCTSTILTLRGPPGTAACLQVFRGPALRDRSNRWVSHCFCIRGACQVG